VMSGRYTTCIVVLDLFSTCVMPSRRCDRWPIVQGLQVCFHLREVVDPGDCSLVWFHFQ
jgi:hypothetical protein